MSRVFASIRLMLPFLLPVALPSPVQPPCQPARVIVFLDYSKSMDTSSTPRVSRAEFGPLVDHLRTCGGELAVGLIGVQVSPGLRRLYIRPHPVQTDTVNLDNNLFVAGQQHRANNTIRASNAALISRWKSDADADESAFWHDLDELLSIHRGFDRSDVCRAVRRADLFFGEPDPDWSNTTRIAIFVSDGDDTTQRGVCAQLRAQAVVIVVKDGDGLFDLAPLTTNQYASFAAAIRAVSR